MRAYAKIKKKDSHAHSLSVGFGNYILHPPHFERSVLIYSQMDLRRICGG